MRNQETRDLRTTCGRIESTREGPYERHMLLGEVLRWGEGLQVLLPDGWLTGTYEWAGQDMPPMLRAPLGSLSDGFASSTILLPLPRHALVRRMKVP